MAQQSRRPLPPRRSLPPLSFGDPELDNLIANDNHPTEPPPPPVAVSPRTSLPRLTFASIPPPAKAPAATARPSAARASAVPARTSAVPARASAVPARASAVPGRASAVPAAPAAPSAALDALLGAIPSIPPGPVVDPSFVHAKDPSFVSARPPPKALAPPPPPPPWHAALSTRFHDGVDALVERLPEAPAALDRLPPQVAAGLALVALWFQLGAAVRWFRALLRLLNALSG